MAFDCSSAVNKLILEQSNNSNTEYETDFSYHFFSKKINFQGAFKLNIQVIRYLTTTIKWFIKKRSSKAPGNLWGVEIFLVRPSQRKPSKLLLFMHQFNFTQI